MAGIEHIPMAAATWGRSPESRAAAGLGEARADQYTKRPFGLVPRELMVGVVGGHGLGHLLRG